MLIQHISEITLSRPKHENREQWLSSNKAARKACEPDLRGAPCIISPSIRLNY